MKPAKLIVFFTPVLFVGIACATFMSGSGAAAAATVADAATATSSVSASSTSTILPAQEDCGITATDIAKITAVENDPSLTASQEIVQELAIRKSLVGQTIACAQGNVQALQAALAKASVNGNDAAQSIQNQLQGRLDDAANFYNIELGKLDGAGIAGSKAVASEVLAWREGAYAPLAGQVNNFVLWTENQGLFATAKTRMNQTQQAVNFLEGASANPDLQNAFDAAYASFQTAESDNDAAQAALAQGLSPDQSLALIKQSLDALQGTYQQFFKVSSIIQTLLPQ